MAMNWNDWWRKHGDERLSLLLWAVWNPIGPVPLDEYENYTGQVVSVLRNAHDRDQELFALGDELTDAVQRQRNAGRASATEELGALLAKLREEQMGMPPNADADRRAAATILDWYEWEMHALTQRRD